MLEQNIARNESRREVGGKPQVQPKVRVKKMMLQKMMMLSNSRHRTREAKELV